MKFEIVIALILAFLVIAGAMYAVFQKKIVYGVIATGVISLFASIYYMLLHAPDVAMTEASIGSGLTTAIFLFIIYKDKKERENG